MKILHIILAFLILTISVLPCTDSIAEKTQHQEDVNLADTHAHTDADHSDSCAPFCHCECCGVSVVMPHFGQVQGEMEIIPLKNESFYAFHYTFLHSNGVWHPPALS